MIAELTVAADHIRTEEAIRLVVIKSEGPSFCAGADLAWMKAQQDADRAGKMAEATKLAMMLKTFHDLPKPVIARVQGQAFGGGLGLMAVADIVIAAEDARFALTETRLGLIPATIGPFVMAKLAGQRHALFLLPALQCPAEGRQIWGWFPLWQQRIFWINASHARLKPRSLPGLVQWHWPNRWYRK